MDGSDSMKFMEWCNGKHDAVYIFEPDIVNRKKYQKCLQRTKEFPYMKKVCGVAQGNYAFRKEKKKIVLYAI